MRRFILSLVLFMLVAPAALLAAPAAFGQDAMDLVPEAAFTAVGGTVELAVEAQFASAVIGGELGIDYDETVLRLVAVDWNLAYGDDPQLRCPPVEGLAGARGCSSAPDFFTLGQLAGLADGTVASLVFEAVGEGTTDVALQPMSPFADPTGAVVGVSHEPSVVTVVPEPGLGLGLALGAFGLLGVGRRHRA